MVETNALVPELIVSDIERSLAFYSGRAICDLYEIKIQAKKPTIRSVFSGSWCPEGDSNSLKIMLQASEPAYLEASSGFG